MNPSDIIPAEEFEDALADEALDRANAAVSVACVLFCGSKRSE